MNRLTAGETAPEFALPNENGETVKLSDFSGKKVLVYFYPKAMTPEKVTSAMCSKFCFACRLVRFIIDSRSSC